MYASNLSGDTSWSWTCGKVCAKRGHMLIGGQHIVRAGSGKTSVFVGRKHFDPGEAAAQMDRPGLRVGCHPGVGSHKNLLYLSDDKLLWLQAAA